MTINKRVKLPNSGIFCQMRIWLVLMFALLGGVAHAEKILLVPLDSRPAAGQFAQMIGRVGDHVGADDY